MTGGGSRRVLVVDGSNLAHSTDPPMGARATLDLAVQAALHHEAELIITFDGDGPIGPGTTEVAGRATVIATGSESADPEVARQARQAAAAGRTVWVATADVDIRRSVASHAERLLDPGELAAEIAGTRLDPENPHVEAEGATTQLGTVLPADVAARLEQIRRGGDPD